MDQYRADHCMRQCVDGELGDGLIAPLSVIPTFLTASTTNIVLICTAMAFGTIFKIPDAFFHMFRANIRSSVFVAAVAGKLFEIAFGVAGFTFCFMVFIQHEKFVVIEGSRFPLLLAMALVAVITNFQVHGVGRCRMAGLALAVGSGWQQGVVKMHRGFAFCGAGVVVMARHAILLRQLVMKRHRRCGFGKRLSIRGQFADVFGFMTNSAALCAGTQHGSMAGKAIGCE